MGHWKALALEGYAPKLVKSSVVCYNFPNTVMLPSKKRQPCTKAGSKGILDLSLMECLALITAFSDTSKDGLHFELVPKKKGLSALILSQVV